MKSLIIPCAGRSSRFPGMKPKYLLTYPDGKLMIEKSIEGICIQDFDRIIVTILREHCEIYEADIILKQAFINESKIEIVVLEEPTSCQSETIAETIRIAGVIGSFVVKDADNFVKVASISGNAVVGVNIESFPKEIARLSAKSFLVINEQNCITDIIEKRIKSQYICVGVYSFVDVNDFCMAYENLVSQKKKVGEIFVSHIISYLIGMGYASFEYIEAMDYEDWGTAEDWRIVQNCHKTYFVNFDGVIIENQSKYGINHWDSEFVAIEKNIDVLRSIISQGGQVIVTTSRSRIYESRIKKFLRDTGIIIHELVMECNVAPQVIINDFSSSNPYPSCSAISLPRNIELNKYRGNL